MQMGTKLNKMNNTCIPELLYDTLQPGKATKFDYWKDGQTKTHEGNKSLALLGFFLTIIYSTSIISNHECAVQDQKQ
jgi:hypothetical protein